ncbi:MAG: 2-dehydropantoate 2-reductase [Sedimentisphaerales bacterium]|nr:2-dehydropantoate 2-reductase [Sedimentisphaerales bacterium]
MKTLIYGGGSVGLGLASCLMKSYVQVDILARENTIAALQKDGLNRIGIFRDFHAEPSQFGSYSSLEQIPGTVYDYILVSTKSFDSLAAAKNLSEHKSIIGEKTKIVLFQNGWGNAEKFLDFFDKNVIYTARVITGFQRTKPNEVKITVHADSIHIGSLFGEDLAVMSELANVINNGDIPCEVVNDVVKDVWAKMLYNCALNPLGAILEVPYGKLAELEYSRSLMNGIIHEVCCVIKKAGYQTHWDNAADFRKVFYDRLVPDTAEHKSSTLQDIVAKKPTEIEALNGAVIELAKQYEIDTPYNIVVYNMIKFIESNYM